MNNLRIAFNLWWGMMWRFMVMYWIITTGVDYLIVAPVDYFMRILSVPLKLIWPIRLTIFVGAILFATFLPVWLLVIRLITVRGLEIKTYDTNEFKKSGS